MLWMSFGYKLSSLIWDGNDDGDNQIFHDHMIKIKNYFSNLKNNHGLLIICLEDIDAKQWFWLILIIYISWIILIFPKVRSEKKIIKMPVKFKIHSQN